MSATATALAADHLSAPREIRLKRRERLLQLTWADGRVDSLGCLVLRRACACSSCTHAARSPALRLIDADLALERVELFGVSGLQLFFSDGHSRGVYPWRYLRELGEN
jgi:DUF971 family protein